MNRCLTVYDVTGIQEFIFASNKAKENIGGSIYVQNIFEQGLISCIEETLGQDVQTNWKELTKLTIDTNDSLKAEVIYIGGGNAMIMFDNKDSAIAVTKKLSKKILEETQATLGVVVAYLETNLTDFNSDKNKIFKILNQNKAKFIQSKPLRGISITRECADGLSSSGKKDGEKRGEKNDGNYISDIANRKRELIQIENKKGNLFSKLLPELSESNSPKEFPKEFNGLGKQEGESHIAVIHIDGNSMGRFIDEKLNSKSDYKDAIPVIRDISLKIQKLYFSVFKKMVTACDIAMENDEVKKRISLKDNILPIRPIILNGDDVTFVCDGRIAIQLADFFLTTLANTKLKLNDGDENMTACAGIAIVKSHFPFFIAYELAENLCGSAKTKAKYFNKENPGCWMDYHIVYSGFQTSLDAMRKIQYNIPGMEKVPQNDENRFPQYNLLLRPFCVSDNSEPIYNWAKMKALYTEMNKFPRSRLKNLRNSFISSESEVNLRRNENKSRGYQLPKYEIRDNRYVSDNKLFTENQTPYFEPLELLDFYIPKFQLGKGE